MVGLYNIKFVASQLAVGKYTGEEVMRHFRSFYGDEFTNHDFTRACRVLQWRVSSRGVGRGYYVIVKHLPIKKEFKKTIDNF